MSILEALFDFSFTEFLTGTLVKFLYGLTAIGVGLVYVVAVIASFSQGAGQAMLVLIGGGIVALLVLAYVRIVLEFVMVLFQIYENTRIIAGQGGPRPAQSTPQPASATASPSADGRAAERFGALNLSPATEDERRKMFGG